MTTLGDRHIDDRLLTVRAAAPHDAGAMRGVSDADLEPSPAAPYAHAGITRPEVGLRSLACVLSAAYHQGPGLLTAPTSRPPTRTKRASRATEGPLPALHPWKAAARS